MSDGASFLDGSTDAEPQQQADTSFLDGSEEVEQESSNPVGEFLVEGVKQVGSDVLDYVQQEQAGKIALVNNILTYARSARGGDERKAVTEISRETGTPTAEVMSKIPALAEMADENADALSLWLKHPEVFDAMVNNPDMIGVTVQNENLGKLQKMVRAAKAYSDLDSRMYVGEESEEEYQARMQTMYSTAKEKAHTPQPVATKDVSDKEGLFGGIANTARAMADRFSTAFSGGSEKLALEKIKLEVELQIAKDSDEPDAPSKAAETERKLWEVERKIIDNEREMFVQKDYQLGVAGRELETLAEFAGGIGPFLTIKNAPKLVGAAAGFIGGVGVSVAGKEPQPGLPMKLAKEGWRVGTPIGYALEAAYMYTTELTKTYDALGEKTDENGALLDPYSKIAMAAATAAIKTPLIMGAISSAEKSAASAVQLASARRAELWLNRISVNKEYLSRMREIGKAIVKNSVDGAKNMSFADMAGEAMEQIAPAIASGKIPELNAVDILIDGAESFESMAHGGALFGLVTTGIPGTYRATRSARAAIRAERQLRLTTNLARAASGLAESPGAPVISPMIADAIANAEKTEGRKIENLYVDPVELERTAAATGLDVKQLVETLMGPDGQARMEKAKSLRVDEPGQRATLEVPVAEYFEKWGGRAISERLADHTSMRPGEMTAYEMATISPRESQAITEEANRLIAEEKDFTPKEPEEIRAADKIQEVLEREGEYSGENAAHAMALTRAFVTVLSKKTGRPAAELMRESAVHAAIVMADESASKSLGGMVLSPASIEMVYAEHSKLSLQEKAERLYRDRVTGALTEGGWEMRTRDPERGQVALVSFEGSKITNDAYGHKSVDGALRAVVRELRAAGITNVMKRGGDIAFDVRDAKEAAVLREKIAVALDPEGRIGVTITTGKTIAETGKAHQEAKDRGVEKGELGDRRYGPKSMIGDMPKLAFEKGQEGISSESPEGKAILAKVAERMAPIASRWESQDGAAPSEITKAHVESLAGKTAAEIARMTYVDETGLGNANLFEDARAFAPKAYVASIDLRAFKKHNDLFGHDGGNVLMWYAKRAMALAGGGRVDLSALHGDELAAQHNSREEIELIMDAARRELDSTWFVKTLDDGSILVQKGVQFSYGIGETYDKADRIELPDAKRRQLVRRGVKVSAERAAIVLGRIKEVAGRERGSIVEVGRALGQRNDSASRSDSLGSGRPPEIRESESSAREKIAAAGVESWSRIDNQDGTVVFVGKTADGRSFEQFAISDTRKGPVSETAVRHPDLDHRLSAQDVYDHRNATAPAREHLDEIRSDTGAPVRSDGTINAGEVALKMFQSGNPEEWLNKFESNKRVKQIYSAEDIKSLRDSMMVTRAVMQKAYDRGIMPEEGLESALRSNADFIQSLDLTTICPRQDAFVATVHAIERKHKRIFGPLERFRIGEMMVEAGAQPSCWYCYGQASRDRYDMVVGQANEAAKKIIAILKKNPRSSTESFVDALVTENHKWGLHSTFAKWMKENWDKLEAAGIPNEVDLRNWAIKEATPAGAVLQDYAAIINKHAHSIVHENAPKQWGSVRQQILRMRQSIVDIHNARAGLRLNSQTDFRPWHVIEMQQAVASMRARGLKAHVYTKEDAFLRVMAHTGIKFNLSALYATDASGKIIRDAQGRPTFNDVIGMSGESIERWINEIPNDAGGMLVAHTDESFLAGFKDDRIHMIIPYHQGSVKTEVTEAANARSYQSFQHEKWDEGGSITYKGTKYEKDATIEITVDGKTHKIDVGHDINSSIHKSDFSTYIAIINELGLTPKFATLELTDPATGEVVKIGQPTKDGKWEILVPPDQYMKLIRDVAREPNKQSVPDPSKINHMEADKILADWIEKGGEEADSTADPKLVKYLLGRIDRNEWPMSTPKTDSAKESARQKIAAAQATGKTAKRLKVLQQHGLEDQSTPPPARLAQVALSVVEDNIRSFEKEACAIVDKSGEVMTTKKGGKSKIVIDELMMSQMRSTGQMTFTHNHPGGSIFSVDDIMVAIKGNVREMRATTPDGSTWVLRRPKEGWMSRGAAIDTVRMRKDLLGAMRHAMTLARIKMDNFIRAAGGEPGTANAKGYSDEKWQEIYNEEATNGFKRVSDEYGVDWAFGKESREERDARLRAGDTGPGLASDVPAAGDMGGEGRSSALRQETAGSPNPRGWIEIVGSAANKTMKVLLNKGKADMSTIMHEMAHNYLEILRDLYVEDAATPQQRLDFERILVEIGADGPDGIRIENHEKFARLVESYIGEGKAPSLDLVDSFQAYKMWIGDVYGAAKNLGVELKDESRQVFDRMFATAEQIDKMRNITMTTPVFNSAIEAGMSGNEWREYVDTVARQRNDFNLRMQRVIAAKQRDVTTKAYKADLRRHSEAAGKEYDLLPEIRALTYLRTGDVIAASGSRVESMEGEKGLAKMDLASVREIMGDASAAAERSLKGALVRGGESPDIVASRFGFESGRDLLEALINRPERKAYIEERAQQKMQDKSAGTVEEFNRLKAEADSAAHSGYSETQALSELALMMRAGSDAAKSARMPQDAPKERNASTALDTERKAASRATLEAGRGNLEDAKMAQHQRALAEADRAKLLEEAKKATRHAAPLVLGAKKAARIMVDGMKVGAANTNAMLIKERSAATSASRKMETGDVDGAIEAGQKRLLYLYAFREMTKAVEDKAKFDRLAKGLVKETARMRLGRASSVFLDASDQILEAIGYKSPEVNKTILASRLDVSGLFSALEAEGMTVSFDSALVAELIAKPRKLKDMTVSQMRDVGNALAQIKAAAVEANLYRVHGEMMERGTLAASIRADQEHLAHKGKLNPANSDVRGRGLQNPDGILQAWEAAKVGPEEFFNRMGLTAREAFWDRYLESRTKEDDLARSVGEYFARGLEVIPEKVRETMFDELGNLDGVEMPKELMQDGSLRNRVWMMMVALNFGNASNRERLLGGYKWKEENVRKFLENNMRPEEMDFVESIWAMMDKELYPHVEGVYQRVNGVVPHKIEPTPFMLGNRTMRGGYFPARYDKNSSDVGAGQAVESLKQLYAPGKASVVKTFTKERAGTFSDVINLEWSVVPAHVGNVIKYVAYEEFVRDASRLSKMSDVRQSIKEKQGLQFDPYIDDWIRAVGSANPDVAPTTVANVAKALTWGKSAFVTSTLGLSIPVALGDMTNVFTPIVQGQVSPANMAHVLAQVRNPAQFYAMVQEARKASPELRHRSEGVFSRVMKEIGVFSQKPPKSQVGKINQAAKESAWLLMELTDAFGSTVIWEAKRRQELANGVDPAEAIRMADETVRANLPTHDAAEQPAFLRDKRGFGMLVAFMGYFMKVGEMQRNITREAGERWDTADTIGKKLTVLNPAAKAFVKLLGLYAVTGVMGEFLSGRGPEQDEPTPEWVLRKMMTAPLLQVPILGAVAESAVNAGVAAAFDRKIPLPSVRGAPVVAVIDRAVRAVGKLASDNRDNDQAFWDAWQLVGLLPGIAGNPIFSNQAARIGRYATSDEGLAEDLDTGNLPGIGSGVVYGKRKGQPENMFGVGE
jgi:GGDEF domain-containing protein